MLALAGTRMYICACTGRRLTTLVCWVLYVCIYDAGLMIGARKLAKHYSIHLLSVVCLISCRLSPIVRMRRSVSKCRRAKDRVHVDCVGIREKSWLGNTYVYIHGYGRKLDSYGLITRPDLTPPN